MDENINEMDEFELVASKLKDKKDSGELITVTEEDTENIDEYKELNKKPKKEKSKKPKEISLEGLNIVQVNDFEKTQILKDALYTNKPEFQIVAPQSAYSANLTPLVNADIINIMNSNVSWYNYQKTLYKIIYNKIQDITAKMNFETWLKMTSIEDLETFYYGLFCVTFPKDGTISYTCPYCGEQNTAKISNSQLIQIENKAEFKKRRELILKEINTIDDISKYSQLTDNKAYMLQESKLLLEIKQPSLYDYLDLLKKVPEDLLNKDENSQTYMLYITRFVIPVKDGKYVEENNKKELLKIIDGLSINDAAELKSLIEDKIVSNQITYAIKNAECANCKKKIESIPLSLNDALFRQISEKV